MKISRRRIEEKWYDCSLLIFTKRKKMSDLSRFGVSAEEELLQNFDRLISGSGLRQPFRSAARFDARRDS
jgi:hypothetical protein